MYDLDTMAGIFIVAVLIFKIALSIILNVVLRCHRPITEPYIAF